jgi:hypothetical protein
VQLTRVKVEVGDLSQHDADVAVALEDRAQGKAISPGESAPVATW